jgi:hypothetical protein
MEQITLKKLGYILLIIFSFFIGILFEDCRSTSPSLTTEWLSGHPVQMIPSTNQPTITWLSQTKFGFRSDGVVVWRAERQY